MTKPRGSSPKRERQYEHIKDSPLERGEKVGRAEEIAARTVNKERARQGESRTASRTSVQDMSSSRRGGQRSHSGARGPTYDQLYNEARQRDIHGRRHPATRAVQALRHLHSGRLGDYLAWLALGIAVLCAALAAQF